jgi:hypothetical protein
MADDRAWRWARRAAVASMPGCVLGLAAVFAIAGVPAAVVAVPLAPVVSLGVMVGAESVLRRAFAA